MVELVGDNCIPSCFVLPRGVGNPTMSGQVCLSGSKILWHDGTAVRTLSGSNTGD